MEIVVSGASSSMRRLQGGSIVERNRKAPRARGPSRSPATASIAVDVRTCSCAFQLWIVYRFCISMLPMTTLVLGATGKTGRRIAQRLEARGVDVRRGSRATGFEWNDRSTWAPMLDGARAAY